MKKEKNDKSHSMHDTTFNSNANLLSPNDDKKKEKNDESLSTHDKREATFIVSIRNTLLDSRQQVDVDLLINPALIW